MAQSSQEHWNTIYTHAETTSLGWYEETPTPSLQLLAQCALPQNAPILDVGAGASTFIDHLLAQTYSTIIAVDISPAALAKLQQRLGPQASRVRWLVDDLTAPQHITQLEPVALWHDRAVLHFLVEDQPRQVYFATLRQLVKLSGYVIIAAFALGGATKCSGLPVRNTNGATLSAELGSDFTLVEAFDHTYHMPSGDPRPFVYTLFQRAHSTAAQLD